MLQKRKLPLSWRPHPGPAHSPETPTRALRASLARRFELSSPNPLDSLRKIEAHKSERPTAGPFSTATLPGCSASVASEERRGGNPPLSKKAGSRWGDRRAPRNVSWGWHRQAASQGRPGRRNHPPAEPARSGEARARVGPGRRAVHPPPVRELETRRPPGLARWLQARDGPGFLANCPLFPPSGGRRSAGDFTVPSLARTRLTSGAPSPPMQRLPEG